MAKMQFSATGRRKCSVARVRLVPEMCIRDRLQTDLATLTGKVLSVPTREQIDVNVQEHMIVEYYSK